MGGNTDDALEALEEQVNAEPEPIEKDTAPEEPVMDESAGEAPPPPEEENSIDLASDEISDEDIPDLNDEAQLSAEADELLAGLQDPDALSEEPDLIPEPDLESDTASEEAPADEEPEDEGPGFSLDDFSPDSLDDLIEEGDKDKE